jgi:hypothetical protein
MKQEAPPIITPQQWSKYVSAVDEAKITELARWRWWKRETCCLLRDQGVIAIYRNCWAFPNIDQDGDIRSIHYRVEPKPGEKATWRQSHKGAKTHALVFGNIKTAHAIALFESQWDAGTLINALSINPFATHDWALVSTRGAAGARTLKELEIPETSDVYIFPQNDEAGLRLIDAVVDILGRSIFVVSVPSPHNDLGDWGRNGLTPERISLSIKAAVQREPPRKNSPNSWPGQKSPTRLALG